MRGEELSNRGWGRQCTAVIVPAFCGVLGSWLANTTSSARVCLLAHVVILNLKRICRAIVKIQARILFFLKRNVGIFDTDFGPRDTTFCVDTSPKIDILISSTK